MTGRINLRNIDIFYIFYSIYITEEPRTDLDKDILSILGEEGLTKDLSADPIHADIASRWENILIGGLEEDTKKVLVDRYLPPSNCMAVTPPIMNPEVKIACSESVMRRDERISQVQHQIAAGLSAIGLALTRMLNKQEVEDNKDDIRLLSDAGRLLANVHHSESRSRRELIALNLNKELKETLVSTPISKFLFGNDLEDTIKTTKDLEKSGQQLKPTKQMFVKSARKAVSENYKGPFPHKSAGARRNGFLTPAPVSIRRSHYPTSTRKETIHKKQQKFRQSYYLQSNQSDRRRTHRS
ncbi:unnamed protein product [Callosobruchus maculatus]|uniref:Uncharacterized protein n=1 Tax=Callosobruchus maculatus TaxID=64391 RepID=A0A653DDF9_CALMS|nr:unnamed protein product [Callosobruchus maculatus]